MLKRDPGIRANQAMAYYFQTKIKRFRGKPRTTIPTKLDKDLVILCKRTEQLRDNGYYKILKLTNAKDLEELRDKAADRDVWQSLVVK